MGRKAKKVISIFLTVVLLFITVPSIEQSNMKTVKAASYNTIAAVNYAMTWGGSKRNPAYKTYDSDCANFVSAMFKSRRIGYIYCVGSYFERYTGEYGIYNYSKSIS